MEEAPKVWYWKGKPVDSLSREELIEAVCWLAQENRDIRERPPVITPELLTRFADA